MYFSLFFHVTILERDVYMNNLNQINHKHTKLHMKSGIQLSNKSRSMQDIAKVATNAVHPKSVARKDAVISFHHLFNDQHHQQRIMY